MISPLRMKKGIARRLKECTPLTRRWTIDIKGMFRYVAVMIEERKSEKVIGNLKISNAKKEPIKINDPFMLHLLS